MKGEMSMTQLLMRTACLTLRLPSSTPQTTGHLPVKGWVLHQMLRLVLMYIMQKQRYAFTRSFEPGRVQFWRNLCRSRRMERAFVRDARTQHLPGAAGVDSRGPG